MASHLSYQAGADISLITAALIHLSTHRTFLLVFFLSVYHLSSLPSFFPPSLCLTITIILLSHRTCRRCPHQPFHSNIIPSPKHFNI